jgi:hypothetical protein
LGFQFTGVQVQPHVIAGVAKDVAKELRLHTVQGVSFNAVTPVQAPIEDFKMS